jgi:hypothetical protein
MLFGLTEKAVEKWLKDHPVEAKSLFKKLDSQKADPQTPRSASQSKRKVDNRSHDSITLERDEKSRLVPEEVPAFKSDNDSFFEVAHILYQSLDLHTTIKAVLSVAVKVIHAQNCSVFVLDKDSGSLKAAAWDVKPESIKLNNGRRPSVHQSSDGFIETSSEILVKTSSIDLSDSEPILIPLGKGIEGIVAETRKGLNIKDARQGKSYLIHS